MKQQQYWFKRRRYGYGWVPVTWQGWLTLLAFVSIMVVDAFVLPSKPEHPTGGQMALFGSVLVLDFLGLMLVCLSRGPEPRWRWGKTDSDNPEEDY